MDGEGAIIPVTETPPAPRVPLHLRYFSLLRSNSNFRRLWMAQLVSELGDWFYYLAVYDLLLATTHSGKVVAWALIIQLIPWIVMTPLTGAIADRFPRRALMIIADVARGFVVLGLLLCRTAADVWLVYVLLAVEMALASVFEPARSALLPNVVTPEEILPANALSSATWSFCLAAGAPLGGAATALLGRNLAFVLNSMSFFLSALLTRRIVVLETHTQREKGSSARDMALKGIRSFKEGVDYIRHNPRVYVLILSKGGQGLLGGAILLLAVFGERVFPLAGRGALAMGLLYSARGVGAGVGPLLGARLTGGNEKRMWEIIAVSFLLMGAAYVAFGLAPSLLLACLAVMLAHMGGSNIWVVSTSLLQMHTTDQVRGRVFAVDFGFHTLVAAVATWLTGVGLDDWKLTARFLAVALGTVMMLPGFLWLPLQARVNRQQEAGAVGRQRTDRGEGSGVSS